MTMENLLNNIDVELNDVNFKEWRLSGWRAQVPEEIQNDWNKLTEREQKLIYVMANKLQDKFYEELDNQSRSYLK
jgi:hypothetical protein